MPSELSLLGRIAVLSVLAVCPASATRYALLVGIGTYANFPAFRLEAPPEDVRALRDTLIKHWLFSTENVEMLLDSKATNRVF